MGKDITKLSKEARKYYCKKRAKILAELGSSDDDSE